MSTIIFGKSPYLMPCALFALAAACSVSAQEDYSAWSHGTYVVLNTTPAGANVSAAVPAFPVLVRLDAASFPFAQARGQGQDIRFSKSPSSGTHLAYQIERWDSAAGLAEIWVKADTVRGNALDSLRMHWGNPAAADSSSGPGVFGSTATGFTGVWHLGAAGVQVRPNSVQGEPAAPVGYEGDEARAGMIGLCDSLGGEGADPDYLNLGVGYADFSQGFTYSVWAYPVSARNFSRLLDLGNGPDNRNVILTRVGTGDDLRLDIQDSSGVFQRVTAPGALALNQWQHFAVTVLGNEVRIYRNGALVIQDTIDLGIANVTRTLNFLGHSNYAGDDFFQGKVDEPRLAAAAHSSQRIRLGYENQKPGQTLVTVRPPGGVTPGCPSAFGGPADTTVDEGRLILLAGRADCAESYSWSQLSGLPLRILDPDAKTLQVSVPRITGDTAATLRFTARFADSTRDADVRVVLKDAVPDPLFTLPAALSWNGTDSFALRPAISNLAAVKASPDSILHWAWSLADLAADTGWLADGLLLRGADADGALKVTLCLDNGGAVNCRDVIVAVKHSVGIFPATPRLRAPPRAWRDPLGRSPRPGRHTALLPRF